MQETKLLNGGLNTDDAPEYLAPNDYISATNYRTGGTSEQEAGYGTNIESTTLLTPNGQLPSGINTVIGTGEFKNIKKAYNIKFNSQGRHQITELDYNTLVEQVIFEDLTDTGGVPVFKITPANYFNDVKLLHDTYLLMTDGVSGLIYCINIERLKNGGYGAVITQDDFNLLKTQNLKPILAEYIDDPNTKSNLIKGKLFQFRSQFEFYDNQKSAWSTISKRPVPELELTDTIGNDPTKINGILLKVNIGDDRVQKLHLAMRASEYSWYEFKIVTREHILSLSTAIDIPNEIYEAYDPSTNLYSFIFYNNSAGDPISDLDTDEPYDAIPDNAGALEVVNGDIVVLGDLEEGYDRPVTDVDISVTSYQVDTGIVLNDVRNFRVDTSQSRISGTHRRYVALDFFGTPKAGDRIVINIGALDSSDTTSVIDYTAVAADDNNLESFTLNLFNRLPDEQFFSITKRREVHSSDHVTLFFVTVSGDELKSTILLLNRSGDVEGRSINVIKTGTSYQLALEYIYPKGKLAPIATGAEYVAPTPNYAITEGLVPQIGWKINHQPPVGAVSYQWLISENTKYAKNLYLTGIYDADESKDDFIAINIASLDRFNKNSESGVVSYDFAEGDRVAFIHNFSGSSTPIKWFNEPPLDFAISGFEIKVVTVSSIAITKYLLKIKKSSLMNISGDLNGKELLLELYTPKKNNENIDTKIFYEIGEQYDIVNGQHSVTQGVIKQVDSYIRPRKFLSNVANSNDVFAFNVEDFNFSDEYASAFWSKGRGRTYNDEVGKVRRKASLRFSDTFSIGSLNNNINRFYANRIYGDVGGETTSLYGAIAKMVMRSRYLIVLQELDVAHIPVYTSILEDQNEQANVAISNKLFNNANYIGSKLGAGLAKRAIAVSTNGTVYFIDPNNGYPCRDGYDGVKAITVKNEKFFVDKLKTAKPTEIVSYFDNFNKEWNVTFTDVSGHPVVFSFTSDGAWEYKDNYDIDVDDVTLVQPSHGVLSVLGSDLLYTPTTDYVGSDSMGVTFTIDGVVKFKNACGTVLLGDTTVDVFSFIDLFDQEVNTLLESNTVYSNGINISVPISIVGGEYNINGGAFTSIAGMVPPNALVKTRRLSSPDNDETVSLTLTMGDKSATWNIETKEEDIPIIACGVDNAFSGGESFPNETMITLGSGLGTVTLTFDALDIPDKFVVEYDGDVVIDTGYRGNSSNQAALDAALAARGLPSETIVGVGAGTMSFTKTTANPTVAIVRVYAPMSGTAWNYTLGCPDDGL